MTQSHLFLTSVSVDNFKLNKIIASSFIKNGKIEIDFINRSTYTNSLEQEYDSLLNRQKIIELNFKEKKEFRSAVQGIYKEYSRPTLCFLGSLEDVHITVQEGMLKLLEEPPDNLILILYANNSFDLLETIKSRSIIHILSDSLTFQIIDKDKLEKVESKLGAKDIIVKSLLNNKFSLNSSSVDLKKVDRDDISIWLWALEIYVGQVMRQDSSEVVQDLLYKILAAKKLNQELVQKKLVIEKLYL